MISPAQNIATNSTFCSNRDCKEPFSLDKATVEIQKSGIFYADCGEVIFQGYKCPNPHCRTLWFFSCNRNNPLFDLRDFIMTPNPNPGANVIEQLMFIKDADKIPEFLKFKFIPAWDERVSIQNFPNIFNRYAYNSCCMIPEEYEFEVSEEAEILPEESASEMMDELIDASMIPLIAEHQRSTMGIPQEFPLIFPIV